MTVKEDQALSRADYWDGRYQESDGETAVHEWFRGFTQLEPFFQKNLISRPNFTPQDDPFIIHLGSGDSSIPSDFADLDYRQQLCVDFSPVAVQAMTKRHQETPGITWKLMDVCDMSGVADNSVDVAFDKGTLDAMIYGSPWSPPEEVKQNISKYLKEVYRVMKDDGVFLYVTFRQPHFMKPLLTANNPWKLDMQVLGERGSFDYYGFVITK